MIADYYIGVGNTLPTLTGSLQNPDLTMVDLTQATIMLQMTHMMTGTKQSLPSTIGGTDAKLGQVQHVWQPGETDLVGAYFYRWLVNWPGGREEVFPNNSRGMVMSIEA